MQCTSTYLPSASSPVKPSSGAPSSTRPAAPPRFIHRLAWKLAVVLADRLELVVEGRKHYVRSGHGGNLLAARAVGILVQGESLLRTRCSLSSLFPPIPRDFVRPLELGGGSVTELAIRLLEDLEVLMQRATAPRGSTTSSRLEKAHHVQKPQDARGRAATLSRHSASATLCVWRASDRPAGTIPLGRHTTNLSSSAPWRAWVVAAARSSWPPRPWPTYRTRDARRQR